MLVPIQPFYSVIKAVFLKGKAKGHLVVLFALNNRFLGHPVGPFLVSYALDVRPALAWLFCFTVYTSLVEHMERWLTCAIGVVVWTW